MSEFSQHHNDSLDYTVDFSATLGIGQSIISTAWYINPTGLGVVTTSESGSTRTVWLTGGVENERYTIECQALVDDSPLVRYVKRFYVTVKAEAAD